MMLEDARQAPLSIFLTVPSTIPATSAGARDRRRGLTAEKIGGLFDRWPGGGAGREDGLRAGRPGRRAQPRDPRGGLQRGRPVSGHIYGREFVAAYAASGVTDTHEAIDREIADDLLEAGIWLFLRGGPPTTPWHSLPQAIKTVTELGASPKRVCVCTDDRDADDLLLFGLDWVTREAIRAGMTREQAWSMGSLHPATRYGMDGEIGGFGGGRRADIVLGRRSQGPQHLVWRRTRRRGPQDRPFSTRRSRTASLPERGLCDRADLGRAAPDAGLADKTVHRERDPHGFARNRAVPRPGAARAGIGLPTLLASTVSASWP